MHLQDADRVFSVLATWRTAGSKLKLLSMKDHLESVGSRRTLRDYEAATLYVVAKCIEVVEFEQQPGGADSEPAPAGVPGGHGVVSQLGQQQPLGPAGPGAVDTSMSHAVEYLTCGWLEKQSGGHNELGMSQKRKLTFGQASSSAMPLLCSTFCPSTCSRDVCLQTDSAGGLEVGHSILCVGVGPGVMRISSQLLPQSGRVASTHAPKRKRRRESGAGNLMANGLFSASSACLTPSDVADRWSCSGACRSRWTTA